MMIVMGVLGVVGQVFKKEIKPCSKTIYNHPNPTFSATVLHSSLIYSGCFSISTQLWHTRGYIEFINSQIGSSADCVFAVISPHNRIAP